RGSVGAPFGHFRARRSAIAAAFGGQPGSARSHRTCAGPIVGRSADVASGARGGSGPCATMRYRASDPGPRLLPDDFRMIRDLVYDRAGLRFDDEAVVLFERRLGDRLQALGLPSYGAYYKYLRFNVQGEAEL